MASLTSKRLCTVCRTRSMRYEGAYLLKVDEPVSVGDSLDLEVSAYRCPKCGRVQLFDRRGRE